MSDLQFVLVERVVSVRRHAQHSSIFFQYSFMFAAFALAPLFGKVERNWTLVQKAEWFEHRIYVVAKLR